jgi:hypothetical protein
MTFTVAEEVGRYDFTACGGIRQEMKINGFMRIAYAKIGLCHNVGNEYTMDSVHSIAWDVDREPDAAGAIISPGVVAT